MAQVACIGDFHRLTLRRCNELKRVRTYVHVGDRLLDLGHVARDALAAGAVRGVMRMRFDGRRVRTVLRVGAVTG